MEGKLTINLEGKLDSIADKIASKLAEKYELPIKNSEKRGFEKRVDYAIQEGKTAEELAFADLVCSIAKIFDINTIWASLDEFESDKDLSKVSVQELFDYLAESFYRET